jgi:tRNA threonylcarbamoyl adenosine modification protein (Sua5/YciO/YrdC/YwlC family)
LSSIEEALRALADGRAIVLPTDTVYGVGADPTDERAVSAIFEAKRRPEEKGLPILAADIDDLRRVVRFGDDALLLAKRFWPGPLTMVLPRAESFDHPLGGTDPSTVAVRVPALPLTLDLLRRSGPLAVTSANRSGEPPAHTIEEARSALGDSVDVYLDGGTLTGSPSTVVSLVEGVGVLREGSIEEADILGALGHP